VKAILIRKYGGPEVLEIADVPAPKPKDGEVVIKVAATSVNPVDWLVRDGGAKSFVKVTFPVILGCDLAGTVVEVGGGVKRFAVGDEVFAMMAHDWGAHAERVALAENLVVKKPEGLSMIEAASLPVVAMTAWLGLKKGGIVGRGERVLVNGASGASAYLPCRSRRRSVHPSPRCVQAAASRWSNASGQTERSTTPPPTSLRRTSDTIASWTWSVASLARHVCAF
jgi:D-arabinose 1-dehydrogenase-like Zn-dependent alcohol dehydrogenase